jgi:hypothetical protein
MPQMFYGCNNFNQPVTIPNGVTNIFRMFCNSYNFGSNVYVYPANLTRQSVANMFQGCNNQSQKHIFTNDTNVFNGTIYSQSITGTAVTWTQDGDNYYNTAYNIYIHNVANPYTVLNNARYTFGSDFPLPDSPAIVFGSGVRDLSFAFNSVLLDSNNTLILFEEGVETLESCFFGRSYFNQPLTIPSSATNCRGIIEACPNFNSDIVFRNGVELVTYAIANCQSFEANIWLPESVTNMKGLFIDTPYANGIVHISHNIALGDTSNYIYSALTVISGEDGTESGLFVPLDPSRILNDY